MKSGWEWSFSTVSTAWPLKLFIRRPGFLSWFNYEASTLFPVLMRSLYGFLTCKIEMLAFTVFKHIAHKLDLKAKVKRKFITEKDQVYCKHPGLLRHTQ